MSNNPSNYEALGRQLEEYCIRFSIPIEHIFEVMNDQKVVPMLRGKGLEYSIFDLLTNTLDPDEWVVGKPDLNAQPGQLDIDVDIIHRKTGSHINAESKSAVRGSMKSGRTTRKSKTPHFRVKCHRSRSNKSIGTVGSDRYKVGDFDIVISNPLNAVFAEGGAKAKRRAKSGRGQRSDTAVPEEQEALRLSLEGAMGQEELKALRLINDAEVLDILYNHYNVEDRNKEALLKKIGADFRFALAQDIADDDGFIPHDPTVLLQNDPHWRPLSELPDKAEGVARLRAVRDSRGSS